MISDISCVILSGGKSSRMGEDKSLLPFGKYSTLIEYQYAKYTNIFSHVYISSKTNKFNFDVEIIYDNNKNLSSPMVALSSILESIKTNKVFIISVDTPLIKCDTIDRLINKSIDCDIVIAKDSDKTHNLCGVFSRSLLPLINNMITIDNHRINGLIKNSNSSCIVKFDDAKQFININNKNDYKEALYIIKNYI